MDNGISRAPLVTDRSATGVLPERHSFTFADHNPPKQAYEAASAHSLLSATNSLNQLFDGHNPLTITASSSDAKHDPSSKGRKFAPPDPESLDPSRHQPYADVPNRGEPYSENGKQVYWNFTNPEFNQKDFDKLQKENPGKLLDWKRIEARDSHTGEMKPAVILKWRKD